MKNHMLGENIIEKQEIYTEHLIDCLVQIQSYSHQQKIFWDFHEPLECFFPIHFTLSLEDNDLILQIHEKKEIMQYSFSDFVEGPLCFQLKNPDFEIHLSKDPTDPLSLLNNAPANISAQRYGLIQGFGSLFHQMVLLKEKEIILLEGVPLFSLEKDIDSDGYILNSFIDELQVSLDSKSYKKIFKSDHMLLLESDLQRLRLSFHDLWWQYVPLEWVEEKQFWNDALLEENTVDAVVTLGDASLVKGSMGWGIALLLIFLPLLVLVQYFQDKPRKIEKIAEIQMPIQSTQQIEKPKPIPPKPIPPKPKPKPIPPKPKPIILKPQPMKKQPTPMKKIVLKSPPPKAPVFRQQIQKKFVALRPVHAPAIQRSAPILKQFHVMNKLAPPPVHAPVQPPAPSAAAVQKSQVLSALSFLSATPTNRPAPVVSSASSTSGRYESHWAQGKAQSNKLSSLRNKSFYTDKNSVDSTESIQSYSSHAKGSASGITMKGKFFNNVQAKVSIAGLSSANGSGLGSSSSVRVSGKGSASESAILKALSAHLAAFEYCYEKALLTNPNLSGQVVMQWSIAASGQVQSVQNVRSEISHQGLMHCLSNEIKRISFPAPRGGSVTIEYPFSFSSHKL